MNLSTTFNTALTGLTAATRAAGTVSSNVANAMTEGYGRRELELASRAASAGGGVQVVTERRIVDAGLLSERRLSDAGAGDARARSDALNSVEDAFGVPGDPGALTTRVAELESALTEAISRPDATLRQDSVLRAATRLADGIADVGRAVQAARADADTAIARDVERLNAGLVQVQELNRTILRELASGRSPNGLFDQRQAVLDELSEILPIRVIDRPRGQVTLYTERGAMLLDGEPARIGFSPMNAPLDPAMTVQNGALSGLTLNGVAIGIGPSGMLSGGSLSGHFTARDQLLTDAQAGLDVLAAELIDRFDTAAPGPDGRGLFIDLGGAGPEGLAQRLAVNPAVDPAQGGALWRLRDGLGATAEGPPGDSRHLTALADALALRTAPVAPGFGGVARDFAGLVADLQSRQGRARDHAESDLGFATTRSAQLSEALAADGVDTDVEMQRLLLIERAYAANAKVLQAADEMLKTLLSIR